MPGIELHWRTWDDESVLYEARSGDTHLLDRTTVLILRALADARQPLGAGALTAAIGQDRDLPPNPELRAYCERTVHQLLRLELIERAD